MKTNKLKKKALISIMIISYCLLFAISVSNVSATTERVAWNYDDPYGNESYDGAIMIWNESDSNYQNIKVTYNMGEGICIIRGVAYYYLAPNDEFHSIGIRFVGDSFSVSSTDLGLPKTSGSAKWRYFRLSGPTYLLDDDPQVVFVGLDPYSNPKAIVVDSPGYGHSFYDIAGSGWILDSLYEYFVRLLYEWILTLNIDTVETGNITVTDNVDAYFITLTAGNDYEFDLERTLGTGDINMRIVTYQDLTNDNLAQSSGTSYPKSMTYTPSYTGTYVLLVEADETGADIADYSINYFLDEPSADFTANTTNIIEGQNIQFTYTGSGGNAPLSFEWNFGDGTPVSNDQNPIHQYTSAGTYTVSLNVTDDDDDSDSETKTNYIKVNTNNLPIADFTANVTTIIEGKNIEFTFTGDPGDTPSTYEWDFGDGTPVSNDQNPIHQYTSAGTYTVNLTVTDDDGESHTEIKNDYIVVNIVDTGPSPPPSDDDDDDDDDEEFEFLGPTLIIVGSTSAIGVAIYLMRKRRVKLKR